MRAVALALLVVVACKHEPEKVSATDADVVAGELMVSVDADTPPEGIVKALALDGYKFEYVAAASVTTHLVKVTLADGTPLTVAATCELPKKLEGRASVKFVELNRVRQPR